MSSTTGHGDVLCRYYTPAPLALVAFQRLLAEGYIQPGQTLLDPHAGGGAWVTAARQLAPAAGDALMSPDLTPDIWQLGMVCT